jgi:hypothetical protein
MGRTTYINIFVILHNFFNELSHKTQKYQIELAQADTTLCRHLKKRKWLRGLGFWLVHPFRLQLRLLIAGTGREEEMWPSAKKERRLQVDSFNASHLCIQVTWSSQSSYFKAMCVYYSQLADNSSGGGIDRWDLIPIM